MGDLLNLLWIIFLLSTIIPMLRQRALDARRLSMLRQIEQSRGSRVITMIHRQESMSFLGIPIVRYINIEDSERILRAIRLTPEEMPIDLVVHTPGGLVLAAEQIACALQRHKGKVTVFVPHYAMSGGTLIALAADEIAMDPNAVLGPVDPQLGSPQGGYFPAASVLAAVAVDNPNRDDQTLILADVARKAIRQVHDTVYNLVKDKMEEPRARDLATALSEGRWTHDYPIEIEEARTLGLPATEGLPREIYELMDLYPQAPQRRPTVEFIPMPYAPAPAAPKGDGRK
ncbi:MAG: ATP-dependent Clp protease proteolytic subunit [Armatimonadetes bacterium]|nr:ATP-dependent Clp protease proteolytic subunit [Armatimonadota bacterium]